MRAATKMMPSCKVDGGDQYGGLGTNKGAWPGYESRHQDDVHLSGGWWMVGTNTGAWGPIRGPGLGMRAATKMMYTSQVDGGDQYGGLGTNKGAWPGYESRHQMMYTSQVDGRINKGGLETNKGAWPGYESRHQDDVHFSGGWSGPIRGPGDQ
eukprot:gene23241-30465_t